MRAFMKSLRIIPVIFAFLLLAGCEPEMRHEPQKEEKGSFSHLFTEISVKCESEMKANCDIVCNYVHPNGLKEEIQTNGSIFRDTIVATNVKIFPIVLKLEMDALSNGTATKDCDLKFSYGMTVSSAQSTGGGMFMTISGDYSSDGFLVKQVEPDSIDNVLDRYLPVTLTATITEKGTVSIR